MNCSAVALYSETVEVQEGFWRATRDTLVTHECRIGGVCKGGVLRPGNSTGGASAVPCRAAPCFVDSPMVSRLLCRASARHGCLCPCVDPAPHSGTDDTSLCIQYHRGALCEVCCPPVCVSLVVSPLHLLCVSCLPRVVGILIEGTKTRISE
jgi:hypothetical protein